MNYRVPVLLGLVISVITCLQPVATGAQQPSARKGVNYIGGVPDTGQFLPNTAVLARIDDRTIIVGEYIDAYFNSYAEFRPPADSLGRVRFLDSMVRKEVLARIAFAADRPLTFEDRFVLREHLNQVLSNVLYQRVLIDKVSIKESRVQDLYLQIRRQLRLRHILFDDPMLAQKVRLDLLAGRISWKAAVKKYSKAPKSSGPDGELGWTLRIGKDPYLADILWALSPGEISEPVSDAEGTHLIQCIEDKLYDAPALESLRGQIESLIRQQQVDSLMSRLNRLLAEQAEMVYDTTEILRAASMMPEPPDQSMGMVIQMDVPHFSDEDTARTLARYKDGVVTLGTIMAGYGELNPMLRPALNSFDAMVHQIQAVGLETHRVDLARRMGLESDSLTVASHRRREEQLRVEHMYQDSVLSKVYIGLADRRAYYAENKHQFLTYANARFAAIHAALKDSAEALATRLRAGERAADILLADSLSGVKRGSIQGRSQGQQGHYHDLVFEILQPGEVMVLGPDSKGEYAVLQLLERTEGKQLSFEEVDHIVDESMRNMKAEELLLAMLQHHASKFHIKKHPERLMLVRLVDPLL